MRRLQYCPNCGKEKQFGCKCEYGDNMRMKMEPNERQKDFFSKRYCPKCGNNASGMSCKSCSFSFSDEDFWVIRLW